MSVKTARCTAQGVIRRSEHLRAAVLQHPNSQQSTRKWCNCKWHHKDLSSHNSWKKSKVVFWKTAFSTLYWNPGEAWMCAVGRHLLIHRDAPALSLWKSRVSEVFKISLQLSIWSFFFKATYGLKTRSRSFQHHLDSLKMSAQGFGSWAYLHHWKQPHRGSKKAGTIKETWDYSDPEKSHITDCLWKTVATLLFSCCNHTSHKSGSQNDTTQKVSVWPDSKEFI